MAAPEVHQKLANTNKKGTVAGKGTKKANKGESEWDNDDAFVNDKTSAKDRRELYLYLNLVIRLIQWFSALKLIPLVWNKKRRRVQMTNSQLSYLIWFFCVQITTMAFIYGAWRLTKEFFDPTPTFQAYKIIVYILYDLTLGCLLVYNYTLIFRQRMSVQLFNTYINTEFALTDILCEKGYTFGKEQLREFQKFRASLMFLMVVFGSANWMLPLQTMLVDTDLDPIQRFLLEHYPPDFAESPLVRGFMAFNMFILMFHITGTAFIASLACMTFAARINHYIGFILMEDKNKLLLDDPRSAVKMHIYLDYICKSINAWSSFVTPALLFLGNLIHTMCIFTAIKLSDVIPMPGFLYFPLAAIMLAVFELQIIPYGGELYDRSSRARSVWAAQPMEKSASKQIRTMVPFGLSAQFFWIKKATAITFLEIAVNNTIDMILSIDI